jgi:hypothetical protein
MEVLMKFKVLFLTVIASITLATASVQAEVREAPTMALLNQVVTAKTLLVFDIDNTLLEPVTTLGSDQWYGYDIEKHKARGEDQDTAIMNSVRDWLKIQPFTSVRPVERITPAIIQNFQARGVRVMGLTARPIQASTLSARQLASAGIDLSKTPPRGDDLELTSDDRALFTRGILYVGPRNNKGLVLMKFLKMTSYRPARIVFADDKPIHVHNMDVATATEHIPYLGLRYGAADARVRQFNPKLADLQWMLMGRVLPDGAAKLLLDNMGGNLPETHN